MAWALIIVQKPTNVACVRETAILMMIVKENLFATNETHMRMFQVAKAMIAPVSTVHIDMRIMSL